MSNYETTYYNSYFHHIYIEKKAFAYPLTEKILKQLNMKSNSIIEIEHYKDVFNRSNQCFHEQKKAPSLILAVKEGTLVYPGAPVCQSFGQEHFYYTSCIMNCIYDCEYCYLQGMYPSANLVIFVNLDDIFHEVEQLLAKHPVYLCISYDTDLLALESMLGIVHQWMSFVETHEALTVELRTKSANLTSILDVAPNDRFILAWTLSPDEIASSYEHNAPSTKLRIQSIQKALTLGYPVRLCFDPVLLVKDYRMKYGSLVQTLCDSIDITQVRDVSLGVFRISADYMSAMRKGRPDSSIIQFPYENDHGVFHIPKAKTKELMDYMTELLSTKLPKEKLFIWEEN